MKGRAFLASLLLAGFCASCQRPADHDLVSVNVVGEVSRPGRYQFSKNEGMLNALAQAGWFVKFADTRKVRIIHSVPGQKPAFTVVDVDKILSGIEAEPPLAEDCTIYVGPKMVNL